MSAPRESMRERFEAKVHHEPMSGCWLWGGCLNAKGYGRFNRGGKTGKILQATTAAIELYTGATVPHGLMVCHRCDNPPCVNPDHLFLGTSKDNSDDKWRKGRGVVLKGDAVSTSKLTAAIVVAIREERASGAELEDLAGRYGLANGYVSKICLGWAWPHVGGPRTRRARWKTGHATKDPSAKNGV